MKYLVTGGAGFIGSNLTRALLASGQSVRVLDNFLTGKRENLAGLAEAHGGAFELIEGDLRDLDTVRKAAAGVEFVLHQGALPSVPRSVADPVLSNEINVAGTVNLLVAARDAGVRRVVFAASSSAYGDTPQLPKRESMTPNPKSPYAAQKLMGEYYLRIFHEIYGLETVSLRYFNVFGPRQDPKSTYAAVIPRFITSVLRGVPPTVYGDGLQTRDFTYIDNVIQANLGRLRRPEGRVRKGRQHRLRGTGVAPRHPRDRLRAGGEARPAELRTGSRGGRARLAGRHLPRPGSHRLRPEGSLLRGSREDVRLVPRERRILKPAPRGAQVVIFRVTTRKAEWENIHWTGRTEFPFTCQGRRITSNVSGSAKPPSSAYRSHSCFTWIVEGR